MNPNSSDRAPKRTFHDLVHQAFDKPQVRLIVDLTDFDSEDLTSMFDSEESMLKILSRYARSFGALVDTQAYYPSPHESSDLDVATRSQYAITEMTIYAQSLWVQRSIFILVGTNPVMHNQVAELLTRRGNVLILLGKDSRDNASVFQHDLVFYMPLSKLSNQGEKVDTGNYDFEKFVRLLLTSEQKMPFVGVKYFINKVMWRLGPGHSDPTVCQEIFQAARDSGIVEMSKSDNVNPNSMPVSSCRADRTNAVVQKVLESMEAGEGDQEFSTVDMENVQDAEQE